MLIGAYNPVLRLNWASSYWSQEHVFESTDPPPRPGDDVFLVYVGFDIV